jgi:transposase
MPAERAPMRKVREVLRLRHALGVSERQIAITMGVSRSTVGEYLRRAAVIGITWPVPEDLDDAELERRLFTPPTFEEKLARRLPHWSHIHKELKRRGVTLLLLWEEYRAEHVDGYGYSRFCDLYRDWGKSISPSMRQIHGPAEKLFVDFAGDTVPVFDAGIGVERRAQIFVAVLGASNYTFAQGRWTQGLSDWIGAHVDALNAIGGVPKAIVCDNLKAGVTSACRYEPGINRTYQELAEHYDTAILPTRPRKPRDKAKVEAAVLIVERYVLARLRNQRFFSLNELNTAIREIVADLNAKIMRKLGVSRAELFAQIDRPALKGLPAAPYQYAEWKKCRVAPDYHIEIADHYYSVPSRLIREMVEARITDTTVEILHKGVRVASHARSHVRYRHTTIPEHMPSAHRRYAEWTPTRMMREAAKIGPATIALIEAIMKAKPHPEQGFRACLGILRLARSYGSARIEAACRRGNDIGATSYGSIKSILQHGLDRAYADEKPADGPPIQHGNIRGTGYYH